MFDPAKDAEPMPLVKRSVRFWVQHCVLGVSIEQIAHSWRLDPIQAGEEIIQGANDAARYPTMTRCETLRAWIDLAQTGGKENYGVVQAYAHQLLEVYDEKEFVNFLHMERGFSMHELTNIFSP